MAETNAPTTFARKSGVLMLALLLSVAVVSCGNEGEGNRASASEEERTTQSRPAGEAGNGSGTMQASDTRVAQADGTGTGGGLSTARAFQEAFHAAAETVIPAVVEVNVVNVVDVERRRSPFNFFGEREGGNRRQFRQRGLGSGVLVRQDGSTGYAITNAHVVAEADEIELVLEDGRSFEASIVASDDRIDLALLSFDTDGQQIPTATFADSSGLQVGDWVVAVGNPLGFESTVTTGIVSALGRQPSRGQLASSPTEFIQTDAAINRGNSGGALANLDGELIGINTWIASQSGGSIGLGFAIPSNVVRKAVDDFITEGRIVYGWLGVSIGAANPNQFPNIRSDLGLGDRTGAFVLNVYQGSPADEGALQPGDFITAVNGTDISGPSALSREVAGLSPGESVQFTVVRYGRERRVSVDITARPTEQQLSRQEQSTWPGLVAVNISDTLRERLQIPFAVSGLLVAQVQAGSAAAGADVQRGDVIEAVAGEQVTSMRGFYRALNEARGRVTLRLNRGGDTVTVELPQ
jgi:serine protease Do